jgi:hypothetical protein
MNIKFQYMTIIYAFCFRIRLSNSEAAMERTRRTAIHAADAVVPHQFLEINLSSTYQYAS